MSDELKEKLRLVPERTYPMPVMLALFEEALNRIEELEEERDEALKTTSALTHCVHFLEGHVRSLQAELQEARLQSLSDLGQAHEAYERQKELEAKVQALVDALERIASASDFYGVEANAEDQGADTLAYAHKSTSNLARATLAALKGQDDE